MLTNPALSLLFRPIHNDELAYLQSSTDPLHCMHPNNHWIKNGQIRSLCSTKIDEWTKYESERHRFPIDYKPLIHKSPLSFLQIQSVANFQSVPYYSMFSLLGSSYGHSTYFLQKLLSKSAMIIDDHDENELIEQLNTKLQEFGKKFKKEQNEKNQLIQKLKHKNVAIETMQKQLNNEIDYLRTLIIGLNTETETQKEELEIANHFIDKLQTKLQKKTILTVESKREIRRLNDTINEKIITEKEERINFEIKLLQKSNECKIIKAENDKLKEKNELKRNEERFDCYVFFIFLLVLSFVFMF